MSSLRSQILKHALPQIPTHSFTRQSLIRSLPSLPPSHPDYKPDLPESTIDTLFGAGSSAPQALVGAWEEEGLRAMSNKEGADLRGRMKSRLRYSSEVGEHLVEAYALMASPGTSSSIPIPRISQSILNSFRNITLPPLYAPPVSSYASQTQSPPHSASASASYTSSSTPSPSHSASEETRSVLDSISHRLPLLSVNPIGPLSYAWQIADHALRPDEKAQGVTKGIMDEPTGSGPEWYTARVSLMIAYLAAESRLLQPIAEATGVNPHLRSAEQTLDEHLDRYETVTKAVSSGEDGLGQAMGYFSHLGRSAISLIKSRGF